MEEKENKDIHTSENDEYYEKILKIIIYIYFYEKEIKSIIETESENICLINYKWIQDLKKIISYETISEELSKLDSEIRYDNLKDYEETIIQNLMNNNIIKKGKNDFNDLVHVNELIPNDIDKNKEISPSLYLIPSKIFNLIKNSLFEGKILKPSCVFACFDKDKLSINDKNYTKKIGILDNNSKFTIQYILQYNKEDIFISEIKDYDSDTIEHYIKTRNCDPNNYKNQILRRNSKDIGKLKIFKFESRESSKKENTKESTKKKNTKKIEKENKSNSKTMSRSLVLTFQNIDSNSKETSSSNKKDNIKQNELHKNNKLNESKKHSKLKSNQKILEDGNKISSFEKNVEGGNLKENLFLKNTSKIKSNNKKDHEINKEKVLTESSKEESRQLFQSINVDITEPKIRTKLGFTKTKAKPKETNNNIEIFEHLINDKFNELYKIMEVKFKNIDEKINAVNEKVGGLKNIEKVKKSENKEDVINSKKYKFKGLKFIEQFPFLNAVIQCFIHTEPLTEFFRNFYIKNNNNQLALTYNELIDKILDKNINSIEPRYFIDKITELYSMEKNETININNLFGFIEFFLNQLHEELKQEINPVNYKLWNELEKQAYENEIGKEQSLITRVFQGFLKINNNENDDFQIKKFMYLMFEINSEKLGKEISIFDLLKYIQKENIKNEYNGMNEDKTNINHKCKFFICPKILIIMLKNKNNDTKIKIEEKIEMVNLISLKDDNNNITYHLFGLIFEVDISNKKHYIAKCKNYEDNLWIVFNNEEIDFNEDYISNVSKNETPIILFYRME